MENSNVNIDLIRGHVDTIILRSLAEADKYGYEILREIEELSRGMFVLKQPTLYSCLKRLEKLNYIQSYLGNESNGAQRRYYKLTDNGRNLLLQDQYQWEFSRTIIDSLLSNKTFDKDTTPPPFNPGEFRPLTRRIKKESDEVNDVSDDTATETVSDYDLTNGDGAQVNPLAENNNLLADVAVADNDIKAERSCVSADVKIDKPDSAISESSIFERDKIDAEKAETERFNKTAQLKEDKVNYITAFDDIYNKEPEAPVPERAAEPERQKPYEEHNYISNMGELKNKLYQDGYKLRPYSKRNTSEYYANNFYYSNKLARDCSILCYLAFLIEVIGVHFGLAKSYDLKLGNMFIVLGVFLLIPIAFCVKYYLLPQKKSRTKINFKMTLLVSAIICLNLILIICIIGFFIVGAHAGDLRSMMIPVVLPLIFIINIPLAVVAYYGLFKTKRYFLR